jgi:hypothetical protein
VGVVLKVLAVSTVLATGAATAIVVQGRGSAEPAPVAVAPATASATPRARLPPPPEAAEVPSVAPTEEPAAIRSEAFPSGASRPRDPATAAAPASSSQRPVPSAPPNSILEDTNALRAAQAALVDGDPARSLAALDEMAARHPDGPLREDALAARVLALCAAGRPDEARVSATELLTEFPRSVHNARVLASCAGHHGSRDRAPPRRGARDEDGGPR